MENILRKVRVSKGLSQFALSKLSDITQADISKLENGRVSSYPGWRKRLARALKITEAELFPEEATSGK